MFEKELKPEHLKPSLILPPEIFCKEVMSISSVLFASRLYQDLLRLSTEEKLEKESDLLGNAKFGAMLKDIEAVLSECV